MCSLVWYFKEYAIWFFTHIFELPVNYLPCILQCFFTLEIYIMQMAEDVKSFLHS